MYFLFCMYHVLVAFTFQFVSTYNNFNIGSKDQLHGKLLNERAFLHIEFGTGFKETMCCTKNLKCLKLL